KIKKDHQSLTDWLRAEDEDGFKIKCSIENPEKVLSKVLDKEINDFLDQFILKVAQPNFDEMLEKIKSETAKSETPLSTPIAAAEFCANVGMQILRWFGHPKDCDLSSEEIKKIIESAKGDALRFYLVAQNNEQARLEGTELPEIKKFLNSKDKKNIIRIDHFPGIELRIAQTIKGTKMSSDDQYAFFNSTSRYLEYAATILSGEQVQVAVFNCATDYHAWLKEDSASNELEKMKKELDAVLKAVEGTNKKIILLVREDDSTFDQFREAVSITNKLLNDTQIKEATSQNKDKYISIAGKQYPLSKFIVHQNSGVYEVMKRADFLYDILNSVQEKDTQPTIELGLPHKIYIENELMKGQ
ncbi:MAG: hypothetical protein Q8T08_00675, partial [Ignavibacteria bacterium]|nr:hypothetical protein [Ignavibacteria bacterium]